MGRREVSGSLELLVMLAVMRLGDDAYGVRICREIEQAIDREVMLGSVYAALERLEGKKLMRSALGESTPARGGRAKRYFDLTSAGLREVTRTQRALVAMWQGLPVLERGRA